MKRYFVIGVLALAVTTGVACGEPAPAPTPAPELAVAPTASPTATSRPTETPAPTSTPASTATPTITPTATPIPAPIPVPPSASFSVDVESGNAPLLVEFQNTSQGSITSGEWDFGDGTTSADGSPTHRYTIAGTYNVRLTVSGPGGADETVMNGLVTVQPGEPVSLEIFPPSMTLAVQEGTQFTAVARDEFGNVVPSTFKQAMVGEGGSIADGGLLTTDTMAGTFADTVTASLEVDTGELLATAWVTTEPGPVSSVVVEPSEVTLDIGATQTFSFTAFDGFDNEVSDVIIAWTVPPEAGEIDANGVLRVATKAGAFPSAIRLEAVKGTVRASATANLTVIPDPLATIEVQPDFVFVEREATEQFEAIGLDQYGNEIAEFVVLWEATSGDITQDGLFTAGKESGSYEVSVEGTFRGSRGRGLIKVSIIISCSDVSEIPTVGCEALVALFNTADGPTWTNNSGWLEIDTPCSWHGVTCNFGRVARLELSGNQLSGSIPAELGNLNLHSLELHVNQLIGSIPAELGNPGMIVLDLGSNQLSGNIPVELGNLSDLNILRMSGNQLSGNIPAELGNLSDLHTLGMSSNQLSGNIPVKLGNLS